MQRLIYDLDNKKIIDIIDPCDGTITGTPFHIYEGSEEEILQIIKELNLSKE